MSRHKKMLDAAHRRRDFLRIIGLGAGAGVLASLQACGGGGDNISSAGLQESMSLDGAFWARSKSLFSERVDARTISFNIDSETIKPNSTLALETAQSALPSSNFRNEMVNPLKQRHRIAKNLDVSVHQVALVDSATIGMMHLLLGLEWKPGDVVVTSSQEHPSIRAFLRSVERIYQAEVAIVDIPFGAINSQLEIVGLFEQEIHRLHRLGKRPRALVWSSPTYQTGIMLPIVSLARLAAEHGMLSICDAAHLLGMLDFNFNALGVDFLVASGSKWQAASKGTGVVIMKMVHANNERLLKLSSTGMKVLTEAGLSASAVMEEGPAAHMSAMHLSKIPAHDAFANSCDVYYDIGRSKISNYVLSLSEYLRRQIVSEFGVQSIYSYPGSPELASGLITLNPFANPVDIYNEAKSTELARRLAVEHGFLVKVVRLGCPAPASRPLNNASIGDNSSVILTTDTAGSHWPVRLSTPLWLSSSDVDSVVKATRAVANAMI